MVKDDVEYTSGVDDVDWPEAGSGGVPTGDDIGSGVVSCPLEGTRKLHASIIIGIVKYRIFLVMFFSLCYGLTTPFPGIWIAMTFPSTGGRQPSSLHAMYVTMTCSLNHSFPSGNSMGRLRVIAPAGYIRSSCGPERGGCDGML